ncbi:MAG: ATP-binding protein [Polyangiales bacterium]
MTLYATLPLGWAAVHTFIAASYFYLLFKRRGGDEYLGFALLSAFLALYAVGAHLYATATDEAELVVALNTRLYAIGGTTAAFVAFGHQLMGRPHDRVVTIAWVSCVVGMVLTLGGLFVDPANNTSFRATWVDVPPPFAVEGSPLIALWALSTGTCGLVTSIRALRRPPDGADLRLLAWGGIITVPSFVFDIVVSALRIRTPTLLEHASVIGTVLASWMLLERFLRTGDELAARTDELLRTYEERQHIQEELVHQEQLAAVGELSAIIAHEVRNPLAVLKNAVATLRRAKHPPEVHATLLNILNDESDRLNRLVGDLLTYARPVAVQAQAISLSALIEDALDRVRRANPRSEQVQCSLALDDLPSTLDGDRDLLERVFINVFENALQAMPGGGSLSITGGRELLDQSDAVRIRVQDSGEGMDTLVRSRASEAFFTTKATGTGLGLAIVSRIVTAHGGNIEYLGRRGEVGTTVSIVLPVRSPATTTAAEDPDGT